LATHGEFAIRKWILLGALAALLAGGRVALLPRPSRITPENCHHLKSGMTRAEVEAILGPPGDYRTGETGRIEEEEWVVQSDAAENVDTPPDSYADALWECDTCCIRVYFGLKGVFLADFAYFSEGKRSPIDKFLSRAKNQWHKWFPEVEEEKQTGYMRTRLPCW
jgi:hypothetical protein